MLLYFLFFIILGIYHFFEINLNIFKINDTDKKIFSLSKPIILNYIMYPLIGMIDTLWINKFNSSNDLASTDIGDQIFLLFYLIISFLPSIIPSKITELNSENKTRSPPKPRAKTQPS